MNLVLLYVCLCTTVFVVCNAQVFYITAPSVLRLDSDESIAIAVESINSALINVYIQDHPGKIKNISHTVLQVYSGTPEILKVNLNPADFPDDFLSLHPTAEKFVSLNVHSQQFQKEIIIPITNKAGYVFIQADKPIYTPKQIAYFRIIPLNENALPSKKPFSLQIKNPQNIIVEETTFDRKSAKSQKAFITHVFKFPTYPVFGEWSATVNYGYKFQQNSTIHFYLKEYVLPTFTVELKTPDVILETDTTISVQVHARYVYNKNVDGIVTFHVGVQGETPDPHYFAIYGPMELVDGSCTLNIDPQVFRDNKNVGWFPEIERSKLALKVEVMDAASGKKENAEQIKSHFAKTPYVISFQRSHLDFKPGLVSVIEANVNYVDGRPASGIPTILKAKANEEDLKVIEIMPISNDEGRVSYELHPEMKHNAIFITLETMDPKYAANQAVGHHVQQKFDSKNKAYIAIERSTMQKLKVDDMFIKVVHFEPAEIQNAYYTVSSKGKIILQNSLQKGQFKVQRVEFPLTYDMVPNFRITVFAHYKEELLVDSLNIEIESTCSPNTEVTIDPDFKTPEPGYSGSIIVQGKKATLVGLLGVDEAVYALSKKDLLTRTKVFQTLAKHDLGCGPGGGVSSDIVMANAGLIIASNFHIPSFAASSCVAIKRRKRAVATEILANYTGLEKQCCSLGMSHDSHNRTCEKRTNIVVQHLNGEHQECSRSFLECCLKAKEMGFIEMKVSRTGTDLGRSGSESNHEPTFISIDEEDFMEKGATVRSDFRETWFFEDITIGLDGKKVFDVSLPHSITTWVVQAVSASPNYGICVSEPKKIVSTKKIFLQLNLPYSVVRNEQVEIQATLFNYGEKKLAAVVFMYGLKSLCTGAQEGEKSERKRLIVESHSAASVCFPVIPLEQGQFSLKVVALSPEGSDIVLKKLNVVPEGYLVEVNIPVKLDPTNQQKRSKRQIVSEHISDFIDPSNNLQVTKIELPLPNDFVPGTESGTIVALGDQMGPIIKTAVNNPDSLLVRPRGCGEQNVMFLAPTLYVMKYLKSTGMITPEIEEKGYGFIRQGYGNQLSYRKDDGSYAAWLHRPTSTWLTAFVVKVFCQANELVHIDENVICSGIKWLINHQKPDGSFVEDNPVYHIEMVGGVQGNTPMTAFVLIALEECKCGIENLLISKQRALAYLEEHLGEVTEALPVAIVSYALSLSGSVLKQAANDRLLSLAVIDEERNFMHWESGNSATDVEATSYALLNQILLGENSKTNPIVNWLNSQQLQSGSFKSTQDTVVALQALSEYAIHSQLPSINLVANITSSNERNFHKMITINKDNAHVLQDVKVNKLGGVLFVNTAGYGVGSLLVKMRYNVLHPAEKMCKFNVTVKAFEIKREVTRASHSFKRNKNKNDVFDLYPSDLIRGVKAALNVTDENPVVDVDPRNRGRMASLIGDPKIEFDKIRVKREKLENSKLILNISICARYLGTEKVGMSIVDVGIFSGFEPNEDDLKKLQNDPTHLIEKYDKSNKGVAFYLKTIPSSETYCFDFMITRKFIVGNTQTSTVQVYDYYNPDEICTVFYSPGNGSPILQTLCEGGVCQCAEGGCPPKNAFKEVENQSVEQIKDMLTDMACDNYDFVWKGKLNGEIRKENGFLNISFEIDEVIKSGIEKAALIEGDIRFFLAKDVCGSAVLIPDQSYLIMGIDGQQYKNEDGLIWHRYMLDKKTAIYLWTTIPKAKNRDLQRALNRAMKKLKTDGCDF